MDFTAPSFTLSFDSDDDDPPPRVMDFTAPSFSLGIDSDDDDPPPPAGSGQREQPRGYVAPDAPSFSLGIDFDDDAEEEPRPPAGGRREEQTRVSAALDAPSFSLGIDFDDDAEEEPRPPAGGPQEEQAQVSAAPNPPSFSVGLDDDDDDNFLAGSQLHEQARPQVVSGAPSSAGAERSPGAEEEDDFVLPGGEPPPQETNRFKRLRKGPRPANPAPAAPSFSLDISDDDEEVLAGDQRHKQPRPPPGPRTPSSLSFEDDDDDFVIAGDRRPEPARHNLTPLERLRKGSTLSQMAAAAPPRKVPGPPAPEASPLISDNAGMGAIGTGSLEDEIEDWTTDEDRPMRDVPPSVGSCSTSSNPKFSLLNRGVLMTQSATKAKTPKFTETSNSSASKSLEESCTKKLLPKITISPMRKIHLLDSDTDVDDDQNQNKAKKPVSPIKRKQESMQKYTQEKPTLQQNSKPQGTTVQRSEAMMNDNWATPAFDEFCNEYFKSTKDAGSSQQKESNSFYCSKGSPSKYSIGEMEGHFQQEGTSSGAVLDDNQDGRPPAMHYFFHHDPRVRNLVRDRLQHFFPIGAGSVRENEQSRGESFSYRREFSSSTGANNDWVTPNSGISVPTDVGKRRVHASGSQSGSGHWFTSDRGKKVYVSKNGQELTGRDAYRQYRKESGRGLSRYKKKGSSGTKRGAAKVKSEAVAKQGTSRAKRKR